MRQKNIALACALFVHFGAAQAKKKVVKAATPATPPVAGLMGQWTWGMTPDDIYKVMGDDLRKKYSEQVKIERDVYRQDQLRKEETEELDKVKATYTKFEGEKSGWDVSIIDKQFGQKNDESMLMVGEKDQRRFLFFWRDKLYKQYIAFDAAHPVFVGKTFADFVKILDARFGQSTAKQTKLRTKDQTVVDHFEWAPTADAQVWAIDQSKFYGNYCLVLRQPTVTEQVERARGVAPKEEKDGVIESVVTPQKVEGDPNADVIDEVVGRKAMRTNQGQKPEKEADKKNHKKGKSNDPLEGLNL